MFKSQNTVKMFRNILKRSTILPLQRENGQLVNGRVRMETTKVFKEYANTNALKPAQRIINPFANESSKNSFSEREVGSLSIHKQHSDLSAEEKERRLKVLRLEVDIANQDGRRVPSLDFLKDHHWQHILTLPSKSARMKYYVFLWQIEIKKEAKYRKKEENAAASQERMERVRQERSENPHIVYGLGHVSMFLRVYDSTINHWLNHRNKPPCLIELCEQRNRLLLNIKKNSHKIQAVLYESFI